MTASDKTPTALEARVQYWPNSEGAHHRFTPNSLMLFGITIYDWTQQSFNGTNRDPQVAKEFFESFREVGGVPTATAGPCTVLQLLAGHVFESMDSVYERFNQVVLTGVVADGGEKKFTIIVDPRM